jgi:hypothetical protein
VKTEITLTRDQELRLIHIALQHMLLDTITHSKNGKTTAARYTRKTKPKRQWSAGQRAKFARTMANTWTAKRNGHAPAEHKSKKRKVATPMSAIRKQRARSAAALAHFNQTTATKAGKFGNLIGPLVRRGYLRKTADGYLRTAKVFQVVRP